MKYVLLLYLSLPLLFLHVSADSYSVVTSVPLLFYYYVMGRHTKGDNRLYKYTRIYWSILEYTTVYYSSLIKYVNSLSLSLFLPPSRQRRLASLISCSMVIISGSVVLPFFSIFIAVWLAAASALRWVSAS